MSNFRYQLQAEIDELKELGKSETNVVNFEISKEDESNSDSFDEKEVTGNESENYLEPDLPSGNSTFEVISTGDESNPNVRIGKFEKSYEEWYEIWQLTIPKSDLEKEIFKHVSKSKEFEELHWKLLGL